MPPLFSSFRHPRSKVTSAQLSYCRLRGRILPIAERTQGDDGALAVTGIGADHACLPANYVVATAAIVACLEVDECKEWLNRAEAMKSYARQRDDQTFFEYASRIRIRAKHRLGQLLREVQNPGAGGHQRQATDGSGGSLTQRSVALQNGISERQESEYSAIAEFSVDELEAEIAQSPVPTSTEITEDGRGRRGNPRYAD